MVETACRKYGLGRRPGDALLTRDHPLADDPSQEADAPKRRYDLLKRDAGQLRRHVENVGLERQQRLFG